LPILLFLAPLKLIVLDLDTYLPMETLQWCTSVLCDTGVQLPLTYERVEPNGLPTHYHAYKILRARVRQHVFTGGNQAPKLSLLVKPKEDDFPLVIPDEIRQMVNQAQEDVEPEQEPLI
jgi:hypothetical protein